MHGEIDAIAPKVAAILIGTNDIGWRHQTTADTAAGIDAVVAELHLRLPATKILLMGLLPSDRGTRVRQATAEINSALAARYGQVPYVTYRDVSPAFLLDTSLFSDPQQVPSEPALHPSPEGQRRMAAVLEPTLANFWRTHGMTVELGQPAHGEGWRLKIGISGRLVRNLHPCPTGSAVPGLVTGGQTAVSILLSEGT
jgi:lysophospholipase L1-like esterase